MSETTWTYDAADGVYKSHALSSKMMETAAQKMTVVPFTTKVDQFGKRMGETVTLQYWKELDVPTNYGELDEDTRIPIDKLEMGTRAITIKEWGRGVEYTNLMEQLGKFDPKTGAQKKLTIQMHKCMDIAAAEGFKNAKIIFIPTSLTGGTWDTDGTPSTQATVNLTKAHMGVIRDYMANDLHVPFYEGDHYVGLFATKALRGLKDDKSIEDWFKYLRKGDLIFKSEIGRVEQTRLVEVTHEDAFSNGVGSGSVLGEGVIFGDEAVARVEVDYPHLRANPNYQGRFGLRKAVIWYGIVVFDIYWDSANDLEAKVVRVGSS